MTKNPSLNVSIHVGEIYIIKINYLDFAFIKFTFSVYGERNSCLIKEITTTGSTVLISSGESVSQGVFLMIRIKVLQKTCKLKADNI